MRQRPIDRLLRPFETFTQLEASSGILLLICTVAALVIANSAFAAEFAAIWHLNFTIGIADFAISKPIIIWINDGLMAIFFFVIGLEIKRETLYGELSSIRQSLLPVLAAVGGMVVPAAFFLLLNHGKEGAHGWGIPMATDIAFALGILALLGNRVPVAVKVFLTAVAIVDDLGAVLVIAFFYTDTISWTALAVGAVFLALLVLANFAGVRRVSLYAVLGIGLWVAFLKSGVHPTIAGVLLAMAIPCSRRIDQEEFLEKARGILLQFGSDKNMEDPAVTADQQQALLGLEKTYQHIQDPSQKLEHELHPWVSYVIMPIFALANAGVSLRGDLLATLRSPVTLGVICGLVFGKQIGITVSAWITVKLGWAALPSRTTFRNLYGVAWLGGIGFTMSLFIAGLAYDQPALIYAAKLGILLASLVSGVIGFLLLR